MTSAPESTSSASSESAHARHESPSLAPKSHAPRSGETQLGETEDYREESLLKRMGAKVVISLGLGALFAWLASRGGVPLVPTAEDFASVRWWTVGAYALTVLFTHTVRAARWRHLIAPVKKIALGEVILLNWIGFFAIFALPMRLGEMARPALTKLRHDIGVSEGVGTVAVERVLDGLVTSFAVAYGLFAIPLLATDDPIAKALPFYGYLSLAVFGGAFTALGVFLWSRAWAVRTTERIIGLVSPKLAAVLASKVDGLADGLRSLTSPKLTIAFVSESLLYWGSNAAGMWLLAWGCGLPIDFGHAVGIMGILAIGILLPTGPGLFGNFQLAISTALKLYVASELVVTAGSVYIFLLYLVQAVMLIGAGVIPLLALDIGLCDLLGTKQLKQGLSQPPSGSSRAPSR